MIELDGRLPEFEVFLEFVESDVDEEFVDPLQLDSVDSNVAVGL